jgi:hypothetical protein
MLVAFGCGLGIGFVLGVVLTCLISLILDSITI